MTKGEINAKIKMEQNKLDDMIVDLIRQHKSLQCMTIVKQTLKLSMLKDLLESVSEVNI